VTGWDYNYRRLDEGEIIQRGDEIQADDGSWDLAVRCIGTPAPDPAYTSHRVYRRAAITKATGADQ
jgi:hypothetical protein